ncbi:MAG: energy-coupling factor transporter ATPase [Clostridiales bacterium]|nr:energy-coupling factor transporter ATPase [Candidatus Equinaster intestinalis]
MPFLQVENLTYTYNKDTPFYKDAITDISFSAEKGEIIGIIGHTGSGKSTLVQHLNGLIKANSGRVLLEGKDIWENPKEIKKIRSRIGLVFQYPEYQLFDETVESDIAFGPKNMGITGDSLTKAVTNAMRCVELPLDYLKNSPFELSGGEKRRVAIAGVLAMEPEVIIFDEPTAGLDPRGREIMMKTIKEYRQSHNALVFIVSHPMEDMAELADKILVLNSGRLVAFDTPKKIFQDGEKLRSIGLTTPVVTQIFEQLRSKGYNLPYGVITVDQAVQVILAKGGKRHD